MARLSRNKDITLTKKANDFKLVKWLLALNLFLFIVNLLLLLRC